MRKAKPYLISLLALILPLAILYMGFFTPWEETAHGSIGGGYYDLTEFFFKITASAFLFGYICFMPVINARLGLKVNYLLFYAAIVITLCLIWLAVEWLL